MFTPSSISGIQLAAHIKGGETDRRMSGEKHVTTGSDQHLSPVSVADTDVAAYCAWQLNSTMRPKQKNQPSPYDLIGIKEILCS